jgi:Sec-independent protein translocase protein TatA
MPDLLVILIVILVLVVMWRGPKTLPKLGEALGRGVREARREASEAIGPKDDGEQPPTV